MDFFQSDICAGGSSGEAKALQGKGCFTPIVRFFKPNMHIGTKQPVPWSASASPDDPSAHVRLNKVHPGNGYKRNLKNLQISLRSIFLFLNLEGTTQKTTGMPVGTNSHLHQLKRMVLKDIKNDPSGNSGLKRPLGSLKRRMSEPAGQSVLQCESRLGKGNMEKAKDCGFSSAASERHKNIYTDITNTPLTPKDKKRNEGIFCETEISLQSISLQSISIETDGIASPAFRNEMSPRSLEAPLSSPDGYSASSILCKKNEPELSEFSTINSDKFFSTPMPSKERVRKKLTPVMETEAESSISEEWQCQEKVSTTDIVVSHESPTQTPLYRSFFAAECQEIAKQIKGIKTDVRKSPGKRKSEEFDVSSIDAEPPPYDCTPMKSMLACEVAKMFSSMESSPTKEGLSFFGDSILDLEKTDMQISYFNSPKCDIISNKRHSVSGTEQLSLDDGAYTIQPKRQKTEPLEKTDWGVNVTQVNKMSPLPIVDCLTSETPIVESLYISATSKCGEGITAVFSNSVILPEQKLSDSIVESALLMPDTIAHLAPSISPLHEGTTVTCIKHLFQTGGHTLCTNTTKDNVLNYDELPPADTTRVIEESNTRPSRTSMHEEMTRVPHAFNTTQDIPVTKEVKKTNTTKVIEMVVMPSGSTTQDIAPVHNDAMSGGNTTQVMDVAPLSANTTQDVASVCDDAVSSNTTQVIDVAPLSTNTTQDFSPVHDEATSSNTTQVIDVAPLSADTTQDVSSVRDPTSSNTTQVIDVAPLSANTTQDVSSVRDDATSSNTTQVLDVVPLSTNTTQDVSPVRDATSSNTTQVIDIIPLSANTTQVIDIVPLSANTTQDVSSVRDATSSNTTQVIDIIPLSANTTQDVSSVRDATSSNTTQVLDIVPLSANTTQDVSPAHDDATSVNTTQVLDVAPLSTNTTQDISPVRMDATSAITTKVMDVANTTQDVAPVHDVISQVMDVAPLSTNTTQDITPMHEAAITANTTQMIPVNNTLDVPSINESKTSNTTYGTEMEAQPCINTTKNIASVHDALLTACKNPVNEIVLQGSANRPLGATSSSDEITTGSYQDIVAMQKLSMEVLPADVAIHTPCTDAVPEPLCTADLSPDEIMSANHDHLSKDGTHTSLSMAFNVSSQRICSSNSEAENKENQVVSDNRKNVSKLDPTQEPLVVNDMKELPSVELEAMTSHSDLACVTPEFSPPAQVKPNVTEGRNIGGHEKSSDRCAGTASSQKEVDISKESGNRPLLSESCSMIQEEDSAHDVSVFSVGSLSFVTSTPVPGLNNFQFQNSCRDSAKHDPNVSIGLVLDDSSNKVLGEQRMIPQRSHGANRLDCKDKEKQETSRLSFLPPNMQKRMAPPSDAVPKQMPSTSGIPSARRSLALHQSASHNPARETPFSKTAPKSGIPGRSMIRPPLARQSVTRPTLVNTKQGMESSGGSSIMNKLAENRLRTPGAAVVKAKSVTTYSQLPTAPSSIKPPSRIGAPGTTGRVSIGVPNSAPDLQDTSKVDTVSAVHPPMSTGIRTGPPRPGTSSIRPPLQQLQKVSLKPKVQGLPTKRTPRELPTLGCRKEGASKAESTSVVRSTTKQTTFALDATKQAASFQSEIAEGKPETCPHLEISKCCQLLKAFEDFKRHYELAKSEHERCQQLEMCTCCQLLKMSTFEDFQRLFGQAEKTNIADT